MFKHLIKSVVVIIAAVLLMALIVAAGSVAPAGAGGYATPRPVTGHIVVTPHTGRMTCPVAPPSHCKFPQPGDDALLSATMPRKLDGTHSIIVTLNVRGLDHGALLLILSGEVGTPNADNSQVRFVLNANANPASDIAQLANLRKVSFPAWTTGSRILGTVAITGGWITGTPIAS